MSERYSRLISLPGHLYAIGAPVEIAAGTLLKDNQTGKVLAQLKLINICNKVIKAVKVYISPFDTIGNSLGDDIEYQYLDLCATRDSEFGQKSAIYLPDSTTRSYSVKVTEVIFEDNSLWHGEETIWEPLAEPVPLNVLLGGGELLKQYRISYGADCKYQPLEDKGLWYCTCGVLNHADEPLCHRCRKGLHALKSVNLDTLKKECDIRLAEEKEIADAKVAKTRKKITIAVIGIAVAILVGVVAIIISNVIQTQRENAEKLEQYNTAVSLIQAERYVEAIELLDELGFYKDATQLCDQASYQYARSLFDQKKYSEALQYFKQGDGEDVDKYEEFCDIAASISDPWGEINLTELHTRAMQLNDFGNIQSLIDNSTLFSSIREMEGKWYTDYVFDDHYLEIKDYTAVETYTYEGEHKEYTWSFYYKNGAIEVSTGKIEYDKAQDTITIGGYAEYVRVSGGNTDQGGEQVPEPDVPKVYMGSELDKLLADQSSLSSKLVLSDVRVDGLSIWDDSSQTALFDGNDSTFLGGMTQDQVCAYFRYTDQVKAFSYVVTTGVSSDYFPERIPQSWVLYGTNDPNAYNAAEFKPSDWTVLDAVADGQLQSKATEPHGYVIDTNKQESFQYYCWVVDCWNVSMLEVGGLELY